MAPAPCQWMCRSSEYSQLNPKSVGHTCAKDCTHGKDKLRTPESSAVAWTGAPETMDSQRVNGISGVRWTVHGKEDSKCGYWFATLECFAKQGTNKSLQWYLSLSADLGDVFITLYCTLELNISTAPPNQPKPFERASQSPRYWPLFPPTLRWRLKAWPLCREQQQSHWLSGARTHHWKEFPSFWVWRVLGLYKMRNKEF